MLDEIKQRVKSKISKMVNVEDREIRFVINSEILKASESNYINPEEKKKMEIQILNEINGYGKLEQFISDQTINEIMINGKNNVFVEKKGKIIETDITLEKNELEIIIQKIVSQVNKTISVANPIVDARLKDGSRVNIVLEPVALNGPIITIRKFSRKILSIKDLITNSTIDSEIADFFKYIVENKFNIFISGGTGSGKTTLLNILSNYINEDERIITIEDSAELQINNINNIVRLEARNNNIEGNGEITIRDLIVTSLRMRPDRIIVGEVRGKETFDMLQAMNTGHNGSLSTGHANSARDMLTRLESMIIMNFDMPLEAIKRQIASAIDIIIHISRNEKGERKVIEISQIEGYDNGKYILNRVYEYNYKLGKTIKVGKLNDRK